MGKQPSREKGSPSLAKVHLLVRENDGSPNSGRGNDSRCINWELKETQRLKGQKAKNKKRQKLG